MRIDRSVPADQRTGVSVYYDDYKKEFAVDISKIKPTSAFRRNNPHPSTTFLEPYPLPNEATELQRKVQQVVLNYLDNAYQTGQPNRTDTQFHSNLLQNQQLRNQNYHVAENFSQSLNPSQRFGSNYCSAAEKNIPTHANSLTINGQNILKTPADLTIFQRSPLYKQGETKRDRSVRINHEIKQETRLKTPTPKRELWQTTRSTPVPPQSKPHWVSAEKRPSAKRILSAPPGTNGYTFYPQARKQRSMEEETTMPNRLEAWAKEASNYEKEVVYNMLQKVAPQPNGIPNTPASDDLRYLSGNPAYDYHRPSGGGIIPHATCTTAHPLTYGVGFTGSDKKPRKVHSAPVKKMAGLVPAATQQPLNDHRIYRLKGKDTRMNPTPGEERELNQYMDTMGLRAFPNSKSSRKYVSVPMHSYQPRAANGEQDYQCKVSFFQSVRSPFKKHFVIHPDFTSENVKKRKPVSHTITHFRY